MDLSRVVIGHSGDTTDTSYLEELIDAGSYIGMERFGIDVILPFEERVATVAKMCGLGHAEKMVLSHDACCWADGVPDEGRENPSELELHAHHEGRDPGSQGAGSDRRPPEPNDGRESSSRSSSSKAPISMDGIRAEYDRDVSQGGLP